MKKKVNFKNISNFLKSYWNMFITWITGSKWKKDQYEWRKDRVSKISPKCLEGECIHCGCITPDKFYEPDACERGCYPEWMNKEQWKIWNDTAKSFKNIKP